MLTYDELKIKDSEILTPEKWNGLVEKVEERDHEILSALTIKDGNIGIGTDMPERALHIRGTGLFDDDLIIESNGSEHSGALIFNKSQTDKAPAKANDLLGLVAFRGYDGNAYQNGAYIAVHAITNFDESINGELRIYTTINGRSKERLKITSSGHIRIQSEHGWVDIGAQNGAWSHFKTDREKYYFDKEIRVDSGKIGSYNEHLQLCTKGETKLTVLTNGNMGVGLTDPNAQLVVGNRFGASISGSSGGHAIFGTNLGIYHSPTNGNRHDRLYTPYSHNTGYGFAAMHTSWGAINFYTHKGNTRANQLVTPAPTVAISPSKLYVNGLIETTAKLIDVKRFNNLGDNITYNTGYSHAHWSAAVAGFYIQDGDINEKGAGNMIYVRMINHNGKWHIQADMRSHGNNESWYVDVMFIRKTISRTIGM